MLKILVPQKIHTTIKSLTKDTRQAGTNTGACRCTCRRHAIACTCCDTDTRHHNTRHLYTRAPYTVSHLAAWLWEPGAGRGAGQAIHPRASAQILRHGKHTRHTPASRVLPRSRPSIGATTSILCRSKEWRVRRGKAGKSRKRPRAGGAHRSDAWPSALASSVPERMESHMPDRKEARPGVSQEPAQTPCPCGRASGLRPYPAPVCVWLPAEPQTRYARAPAARGASSAAAWARARARCFLPRSSASSCRMLFRFVWRLGSFRSFAAVTFACAGGSSRSGVRAGSGVAIAVGGGSEQRQPKARSLFWTMLVHRTSTPLPLICKASLPCKFLTRGGRILFFLLYFLYLLAHGRC